MPRRPKDDITIYGPGERHRHRPNSKWCVAKLTIDGRRRDITLEGITDKEEARSAAAEYLRAATVRAADERRAVARPRTFGELAERYAADRRISRHERAYVNKLVRIRLPSLAGGALGDAKLEELLPTLAREAATALYGRCTEKTMNRAAISPFSAIVHFGNENDWMPYLKIRGYKTIEKVTPRLAGGENDVQRLLAALAAAAPKKCDKYKADHPYRSFWPPFCSARAGRSARRCA